MITIIVLLVIAAIFFIWGRYEQANAPLTMWENTGIACLGGGHQAAARHMHAQLLITKDGQTEQIPANVGIKRGCMAEVHTHDTSGEIHIETARAARAEEMTLADFFTVWDKNFNREGYNETIVVNGTREVEKPALVQLTDGKNIHIRYQSATGTRATSSGKEVMSDATTTHATASDTHTNDHSHSHE